MRVERVGLALVLAAGIAGCVGENQAQTASGPIVKGGSDEMGQYMHPANFWKPASDHTPREQCPGGQGGGGGGGGGGSGVSSLEMIRIVAAAASGRIV